MFTLVDTRYKIDSRKLQLAREGINLNMSEFAYECGWSPQYQWKLENDYVPAVSEATKNVIEDVLK